MFTYLSVCLQQHRDACVVIVIIVEFDRGHRGKSRPGEADKDFSATSNPATTASQSLYTIFNVVIRHCTSSKSVKFRKRCLVH